MKNILLSFALCFALLTSAYAQQAPDFTITDTHGNTHTLYADYLDQGYTVVLDLFFVDCGPCNALAPFMEPAYQQWGSGNGDVEFFSLSPAEVDTDAYIMTYEENHGLTFPASGIDGGGDLAQMPYANEEFGTFYGYPTLVVIAPDGSVQFDAWGAGPDQTTIDVLNDWITNTGATGQPINSSAAPSASFSSNVTSACGGTTVTFSNTSNNGDDFTWTFPGGTPATSTEINPTVVYDTPGTYGVTLVATNTNGDDMEEIADYLAVYDAPTFTVEVSGSSAEVMLDTNVATPVVFSWAHDSSLTTASVDDLENGNYEVMITDANGCVSTESFSVIASGISDLSNTPEMSILQNIDSRQVTIQHLLPFAGTSNNVINIYDYSGRLVQTTPLTASTQILDLKADYATGIYIVHVVVNNIRYSKKIMVK